MYGASGDGVPQPDGAVQAAGDQKAAAVATRGERDGPDLVGAPGQRLPDLAMSERVPEVDGPVRAGGGQPLSLAGAAGTDASDQTQLW